MQITGTFTFTQHPPVARSVILYPTSVQQSNGQGDNWPNLDNLIATDGTPATCPLTLYGASEIVTLSGFQSETPIPEGITPTGYTIRFQRRQVGGTLAGDARIRLGHGTVYGENMAKAERWPTGQLEESTYGGVHDLCGLSPTGIADLKLEIGVSDDEMTATAEVVRPSIEVHYTAPGGFSLTAESV